MKVAVTAVAEPVGVSSKAPVLIKNVSVAKSYCSVAFVQLALAPELDVLAALTINPLVSVSIVAVGFAAVLVPLSTSEMAEPVEDQTPIAERKAVSLRETTTSPLVPVGTGA